MTDEVKVSAYDFSTRQFIGTFDSVEKASRKLFIKSASTIRTYLSDRNKHSRGVASYASDNKYHFERV